MTQQGMLTGALETLDDLRPFVGRVIYIVPTEPVHWGPVPRVLCGINGDRIPLRLANEVYEYNYRYYRDKPLTLTLVDTQYWVFDNYWHAWAAQMRRVENENK